MLADILGLSDADGLWLELIEALILGDKLGLALAEMEALILGLNESDCDADIDGLTEEEDDAETEADIDAEDDCEEEILLLLLKLTEALGLLLSLFDILLLIDALRLFDMDDDLLAEIDKLSDALFDALTEDEGD